MDLLASRIVILWGWRRFLVVFLAGMLSALAVPPFTVFPVFLITLPIMVWVLDGLVYQSLELRGGVHRIRTYFNFFRSAFCVLGIGLFFSFGYIVFGMHWAGSALWMANWSAILGLLLACVCMGFGFLVAWMLWSTSWLRVFALAVGLTVNEWLQSLLDLEFAIPSFAMSLGSFEVLGQTASVLGVQGLTFVSVLIFASPSVFVSFWMQFGKEKVFLAPVLGICLLSGMLGYGLWRIPGEAMPIFEDVRLRIVQPNMDSWLSEEASDRRDLGSQIVLSDRARSPEIRGVQDVTHVIWPMAGNVAFPADDEAFRAELGEFLPPGTVLVTTGFYREGKGEGFDEDVSLAAILFDEEGEVLFVRRVRWRDGLFVKALRWYRSVFGEIERESEVPVFDRGTGRGTGEEIFSQSGVPSFGFLVGHEMDFPVRQWDGEEHVSWILQMVGDWREVSLSEGRQRYEQVRLRGIEQGLPVVRAVNRGPSAVLDPYGRVVAEFPMNQAGVLDATLPFPLDGTFFSRFVKIVMPAQLILGLILALLGRFSRRRSLLESGYRQGSEIAEGVKI